MKTVVTTTTRTTGEISNKDLFTALRACNLLPQDASAANTELTADNVEGETLLLTPQSFIEFVTETRIEEAS